MTNEEMATNSKVLEVLARLQAENERLKRENDELGAESRNKVKMLERIAELENEIENIRRGRDVRTPLKSLYGDKYPWAFKAIVNAPLSKAIRHACFPAIKKDRRYGYGDDRYNVKVDYAMTSAEMDAEQFGRYCEIFGAVCAALEPYVNGQ